MAIRGRYKFFRFRNSNRGHQLRINVPKMTAQPRKEIVRQISIANVVIIWWICRNNRWPRIANSLSISLRQESKRCWRECAQRFVNPLYRSIYPVSVTRTEGIQLHVIPNHRQGLAGKGAARCLNGISPAYLCAPRISSTICCKCQINTHGFSISFSALTTIAKRRVIRRQAESQGVSRDLQSCLVNQVAKCI